MGGRRGQLITLSDRKYYSKLINEAVASGARKEKACELVGIVCAVAAFAFNVPAKTIAASARIENNFFIAIDLKFVFS